MSDELLDIVDINNNILGIQKQRSKVHRDMVDWHRTTSVYFYNHKKQILYHLRAKSAEIDPGKWISAFGGHLTVGESYLVNAKRETKEELGLDLEDGIFQPLYIRKNDSHNHFGQVYTVYWGDVRQKLKIDPEAVAEVKWLGLEEIEEAIKAGKLTLDPKVKEYVKSVNL